MQTPLREAERIDDLQIGGYRIIQNRHKFCFGIDAVLLSDFARVRRGENVLDIGTGTGVIPILLAAKTEGRHFTGLEIQEESVEMAGRSVALNGLGEKIDILKGDIRNAKELFPNESFDVIVSNPPYMAAGHGLKNESPEMAIAKHEILCRFTDIAGESARMLKESGRLYLIHRPFRLAEVMVALCAVHLEPKKLRFVQPYADREPNMVLIEAIKGAKPRVTVEKPLIIYQGKNVYTQEIIDIYGGNL
ncbi:MAG: tRNA1(Val) (adenine(37)-N6)-methyltransferase [Lachnospiraceae bacterium]|nr:tRNA1(Val) (adenine(37)-N6)-methyltransferase [Lachnospiraceae bacterium]